MAAEPDKRLAGEDATRRVNQFRFSVELFRRNYEELITFLDYFCAPPIAFSYSWVEQKWLWHEGMKEISFLLHNFVAAAQSLVDHTRVLYRHLYEPIGVLEEYPREVRKRFAEDPLSQFVIKLRAMAQHYKLPTLGNRAELKMKDSEGRADAKIRLVLHKRDLVQFDAWTAPAQRFLDNSPDDIDIRDVITRYFEGVNRFQLWFAEQQRRLHGPAPDRYQELVVHGGRAGARAELEELAKGIAALEGKQRGEVTFADVEKAFDPVLTILDARRLTLCRYDGALWLRKAVAAVKTRFAVTQELEARILALVERPSDAS